jgi:AraC-like DNA-binding protein
MTVLQLLTARHDPWGFLMKHALIGLDGRHDMPWSQAITSTDISDVDGMPAVAVDGIESDCVQLEAKPFSSRWTIVQLAPAVMQFGHQELAIVRRVRVPADRWAFVVPLIVPGLARWDGNVITAGEIVACPPRTESYAFDPAGMQFAIISLPIDAAFSLMGSARTTLRSSKGSLIVRPTARDVVRLRGHLLELKAVAEVQSDASKRFDLAVAGDQFSLILGACFQNAVTSYNRSTASRSRSEIVRRAEHFVREHIGEPISIARLSTVVGVSERSLRNAFYDVYTTSPKRYLKIRQLHRARHALRAADGGLATVTTVATFHGFFELGRFAGEYKALFGETPSQTLQKARARIAPAASPLLSGLELQRRATA